MTTPNYRALCAELLAAADKYAGRNPYMMLDNATKAARAALAAEPVAPADGEVDTRYEFSVLDADCVEQAGGSAPSLTQALDEGRHYLASYERDGPHTLELRRVEVLTSNHFVDVPKMVEPVDGEVAELVAWLRHRAGIPATPDFPEVSANLTRAADLLERIPTLEADLERERIRLAACGVIAMADTPESAAAARDMDSQFQSASTQDVAHMVDELMQLRQPVEPEPPADGEVAEGPSLKEQALELVNRIKKAESVWALSELTIISRALEVLPND